MSKRRRNFGEGTWVFAVLLGIALLVVITGCMPFLNQLVDRKPNPRDTVQPHSAPPVSCVQSVREPERGQLLQQALADSQLQAVRTQLESRGLTMNAAGAMAVHIAAGDQVLIPFGTQAYLVWNRYQSQTSAIGLVRQGSSTLNLTASGQERWVRFLSAQEIQILLTQLRQNGTFSAFENQLHQLGKQLADARVHGFLDVTGGVVSLGLATVDSAAGTFTHQLRVQVDTSGNISQGLEPLIQETACNVVTAQSQATTTSTGSGNRVIMQTTVDPGGGGGGIDPGDTICTSQWGYQYRCTYTTPAFCSDGLSAPLVTFVGQQVQASVIIWNCGGGVLQGTATTDAPFSIVSGGSYGSQPGEPKEIVVGFSPTTSGTFTKTLHLVAGSLVYDVTLAGCTLTVSPTQLNFTAFVGSPQDLQLTVRHDGPLGTVTDPGMPSASVQLSASAPYSMISIAGNPFTLRSGASQQVTVRFNPTDSGNSTSNVGLTASVPTGSSSSTQVSVSGVSHKITSTPTELNFTGLVNDAVDQKLTLRNEGVTSVALTVSTSAPFSIVSPSGPFTLAPNQSQDLTVRFSPITTGTFQRSVNLASDGGSMGIPIEGAAMTYEQYLQLAMEAYNQIDSQQALYGIIYSEEAASGLNLLLGGIDALDAGKLTILRSTAASFKDSSGLDPQTEQGLALLRSIDPTQLKSWLRKLAQAVQTGTFDTEYAALLPLGLSQYEQAIVLILHYTNSSQAKNVIYETAKNIASTSSADAMDPQDWIAAIRAIIIGFLTDFNTPKWNRADAERFGDAFAAALKAAVDSWVQAGFLSTYEFLTAASENLFLTSILGLVSSILGSGDDGAKVSLNIFDPCSRNCSILRQLLGLLAWNNASAAHREKAFGTLKVAINANKGPDGWEILGFVGPDGQPLDPNMSPAQLQQIDSVYTIEFMPKGGLDPNKSFVAISGGDHCAGSSCASLQTQADVKAWLHQAVDLAKKQSGDSKVAVFAFTKEGAQVTNSFIQDLFNEFAGETVVAVIVTWQSGDTVYFACVSAACNNLSDEQKKEIACKHETGSSSCDGKKAVEVKKGQSFPENSTNFEQSDAVNVWPETPSCGPAAIKAGC